MMIMVFCMINMDLMEMDLIKMVIIYMDFDKNGLNKDGLNKYGYNKSSGKGLNISSLPVLLSKIYTNNSSKELINEIKKLVKNLCKNKQITKQVYNILNKALINNDS